jgi:hypothetical protein
MSASSRSPTLGGQVTSLFPALLSKLVRQFLALTEETGAWAAFKFTGTRKLPHQDECSFVKVKYPQQHMSIMCLLKIGFSSRMYLYFDVVAGFVWSEDRNSYAGGIVATGRDSHTKQVKNADPDIKGQASPPGWGLGCG